MIFDDEREEEGVKFAWENERWRFESAATTTTAAAATVGGDAAVSATMDGDAVSSSSNGYAATDDVWSAIHALLPSTEDATAADSDSELI